MPRQTSDVGTCGAIDDPGGVRVGLKTIAAHIANTAAKTAHQCRKRKRETHRARKSAERPPATNHANGVTVRSARHRSTRLRPRTPEAGSPSREPGRRSGSFPAAGFASRMEASDGVGAEAEEEGEEADRERKPRELRRFRIPSDEVHDGPDDRREQREVDGHHRSVLGASNGLEKEEEAEGPITSVM
jgi:hypothetical protein